MSKLLSLLMTLTVATHLISCGSNSTSSESVNNAKANQDKIAAYQRSLKTLTVTSKDYNYSLNLLSKPPT